MQVLLLTAAVLAARCLASPLDLTSRAEGCQYDYFTQKIDHFGTQPGTFQQRYNLVTDYYKPGGPIFWAQGAEAYELDCVHSNVVLSWAKEFHGAAVSVEHRYFGKSKPFNASDPTKQLDHFKYLTLDNVIEDAVTFVDSLRANLTGGQHSKVIVSGGSYPAWLVTMYRQNRPKTFWGAVASSGPVEGWHTAKDNSWNFNANKWTSNVYQQKSYNAWKNIGNAYDALAKQVNAGKFSTLQSDFNLCEPADEKTANASFLLSATIHSLAAQYNFKEIGINTIPNPLDKMVDVSLSENDPIQLLNRTVWLWFEPLGLSCLNTSDIQSAIYAGVPDLELPPFAYLACSYYPNVGTGNYPNGTMFRFPPVDGDKAASQNCKNTYGITPPLAEDFRKKFKFTRADLRTSTRVLWLGGQYDPNTSCMPIEPTVNAPALSSDINVSRFMYVAEGAHCEDLRAPTDRDKETVKQARAASVEILRGWLQS